jgi:hypothetical protein
MSHSGAGDGAGDSKTAPPPFDPEQYARDSETELEPALTSTKKVAPAPPLNLPVRLTVALADLAWYELSPAALELAGRVDGRRTGLELLEGGREEAFEAFAQLHAAGALSYGG